MQRKMKLRTKFDSKNLTNSSIESVIPIFFLLSNVGYAAAKGKQQMFDVSSELYIEPTPVFVRRSPSSNYKMGMPRVSDQDLWYEGSGRGKRQYSLEDFLVWMPSGDGPTERWRHYPSNYDWRNRETTTVYVTSTKYETVVMSPYIIAAHTEGYPYPYTTTIRHLGKSISGSVDNEVLHECRVYHISKPPSHNESNTSSKNHTQNDQMNGTDLINDDRNENKSKGEETPKVDLDLIPSPTKAKPVTLMLDPLSTSYDGSDLIHSSMEYLGPSSVLPTPHTDFATPISQTKETKAFLGVTVYISSYYDMRSFDIDSTNIEYPFSTIAPPLKDFTPTVSTTVKSIDYTDDYTAYIKTSDTPITTETTESFTTNESGLPTFKPNITPVVTNITDFYNGNFETTSLSPTLDNFTDIFILKTDPQNDSITTRSYSSESSLSRTTIDFSTIFENEERTMTPKVRNYTISSTSSSDDSSPSSKNEVYETTQKMKPPEDVSTLDPFSTTTARYDKENSSTTLYYFTDESSLPRSTSLIFGTDQEDTSTIGISFTSPASTDVPITMETTDEKQMFSSTPEHSNTLESNTHKIDSEDTTTALFDTDTTNLYTSTVTNPSTIPTTDLPTLVAETSPDTTYSTLTTIITTKQEMLTTLGDDMTEKSTTSEIFISDSSTSVTTSATDVKKETPCECDDLNDTTKQTSSNDVTVKIEKKTETTAQTSTVFPNESSTTSIPKFPTRIPPSPSNNLTAPLDKQYWVRSIVVGPPDNQNQTIFQNKMQNKLTNAYRIAFRRSNPSLFKQNNTETEKETFQTKANSRSKRMRRGTSLMSHQGRSVARKKYGTIFSRTRRQLEPNIYVRMQDINYINVTNVTELIYSVFEVDDPILATRAVTIMDTINDTEMETLLGYPLEVKAEEYLQTSKLKEPTNKYYLMKLFALIVGISGLIFLSLFFGVITYKRCKKTPSNYDSRRELREGSEISSPRSQMNIAPGRENLGYADSHDEESTPEEGGPQRLSPDAVDDVPIIQSHPPPSQPSPSLSRRDEEELSEHSNKSEENYAVIENERRANDVKKPELEEVVYSTPKPIPLSQRQANIETALQHTRFQLPQRMQESTKPFDSSEFIAGTSLPKFLPPPRPQFPLLPSPGHKSEVPPRNYSLDESLWPKIEEEESDVLPSQVQETLNLEGSAPTTSRASSEIEISSEAPSKTGVGIGRLRRRFHDLLDDAFSLMQGQKTSDKVTHLGTPYQVRKGRMHSAMPSGRLSLLDDLESGVRSPADKKRISRTSRRPWSAAAAFHFSPEPVGPTTTTGSLEASPRSAWGDQRRSITPVNFPHTHPESRPESAPLGRSSSSRGVRSPTPTDPETGLRIGDPALPLIKAIKDELHRFKSSVNTETTDA